MVEMGPTLSSPAFSVKNLSKEKQITPLLFMQKVIFSISSSCCCNGWVRDDNVTSSVAKPSSWACWIILLCGEHSLTQANFQVWDFAGQSPVSAQMAFAFFYVCAEVHLTKSQTGLYAVLVWKCNLLFQMQTLIKRKNNHEEIRYKLCSLFLLGNTQYYFYVSENIKENSVLHPTSAKPLCSYEEQVKIYHSSFFECFVTSSRDTQRNT